MARYQPKPTPSQEGFWTDLFLSIANGPVLNDLEKMRQQEQVYTKLVSLLGGCKPHDMPVMTVFIKLNKNGDSVKGIYVSCIKGKQVFSSNHLISKVDTEVEFLAIRLQERMSDFGYPWRGLMLKFENGNVFSAYQNKINDNDSYNDTNYRSRPQGPLSLIGTPEFTKVRKQTSFSTYFDLDEAMGNLVYDWESLFYSDKSKYNDNLSKSKRETIVALGKVWKEQENEPYYSFKEWKSVSENI